MTHVMTHGYDIYFGWFFLVLGASYFLQANRWIAVVREMAADVSVIQPWWLALLAMGLAIIANHNIWVWQWHVAVTVLGWALAIKSTIFLTYPPLMGRAGDMSGKVMRASIRGAGALMVSVGAMLIL